MAVDMFIKIGDLKGESADKSHPKEINVLGWSWGVSNSGSAHTGGGAGAGKANVRDLNFTKHVDKCSPSLVLACCKGTHYDTAKLVVRKAGGKPLEYLKITLSKVMVSSVTTGGDGDEDLLTESVTLNFAKVKVEYTEQKPDGSEGEKPSVTYNITENDSE
jgi:type VI secretion system secreted protein Hcp